ncbi:MAG: hypothetical protein A3E90_02790 [Candidatus Portnoybacteria bacterium RIFCSPHIGHO2_12_FULL_40_11]|uniref:DZANK-type domain-containing protein n=3 Tax=Candidatus Portnoyibacteriota TaxID=1817913 RepID=A0A1G2FBN6_9BACT|nr:MAG: hypothetical protein A2815_00520 [Candidatus Portnoybacteria bacterium RIFCSPHIGHO2_01_FULL_40_12b]OGZ37737.1 MAG: hypothetical protein A3E90_02790 [Candidatus Portnoybacteria bacterium RIFCSPHIGHO2_12_FULL_40_11]OGZ40282.1 MAG: hypothetical protein A3I20_02120 [Candidatus Portnoybacteria bacterium RIFCSPLOWO2_02_FULL_40_15]
MCKAKLPSGTTKCSKCGRIVKDFKRLCPYCKKVIGLTDDSCRHCGKQFPITIDKLPQIVCGSCGRSEEIDDWFGFRNLPFLFQTERGVKVGCFKDKEIALKNYKLFFEHSKRPETHRDEMDISEDEKPWSFRDKQTAQMFVNAFPCPSLNCGGKNWKLSIFKRFWGAAPSAERIGKGVGTGFLGLGKILTSARKTIELATKPKQETKSEKPEKGGKK